MAKLHINIKLCVLSISGIRNVLLEIEPLSMFVEDVFIWRLLEYISKFSLSELIVWPTPKQSCVYNLTITSVGIPELILWQSSLLARPLTIRNITIEPISILLSLHCSMKMYIALDQSPLDFRRFERRRVLTTPYR